MSKKDTNILEWFESETFESESESETNPFASSVASLTLTNPLASVASLTLTNPLASAASLTLTNSSTISSSINILSLNTAMIINIEAKYDDQHQHQRIGEAMRMVDRGEFIPCYKYFTSQTETKPMGILKTEFRFLNAIYADRSVLLPFTRNKKTTFFHHNAPSLYYQALVALQLNRNDVSSFLHIGSGTSYLNTIVSHLLINNNADVILHGIEIDKQLIEFANCAVQRHNAKHSSLQLPTSTIYHGNGFLIDTYYNVKYDRIYVSANCKLSTRQYFQSLLKENGILVGSFENVLLKMNKTTTDEDVQEIVDTNKDTCTSLTEIEFPFPCETNSKIVLQRFIFTWKSFNNAPLSFRNATRCCLIICQRGLLSNHGASKLPLCIWLSVLSYCSLSWFDDNLHK